MKSLTPKLIHLTCKRMNSFFFEFLNLWMKCYGVTIQMKSFLVELLHSTIIYFIWFVKKDFFEKRAHLSVV